MKYLILVVIVWLSGCAMQTIDNNWYDLNEIPQDLNNLSNKLESVSGKIKNDCIFYAVYSWVYYNINYKLYANGFKPAQKTMNEKEGNCANQALLVLSLTYLLTKEKGSLVYCYKKLGKVEGLHYIAKFNDKYAEGFDSIIIYEEIKFDKISEFIYYRQ